MHIVKISIKMVCHRSQVVPDHVCQKCIKDFVSLVKKQSTNLPHFEVKAKVFVESYPLTKWNCYFSILKFEFIHQAAPECQKSLRNVKKFDLILLKVELLKILTNKIYLSEMVRVVFMIGLKIKKILNQAHLFCSSIYWSIKFGG